MLTSHWIYRNTLCRGSSISNLLSTNCCVQTERKQVANLLHGFLRQGCSCLSACCGSSPCLLSLLHSTKHSGSALPRSQTCWWSACAMVDHSKQYTAIGDVLLWPELCPPVQSRRPCHHPGQQKLRLSRKPYNSSGAVAAECACDSAHNSDLPLPFPALLSLLRCRYIKHRWSRLITVLLQDLQVYFVCLLALFLRASYFDAKLFFGITITVAPRNFSKRVLVPVCVSQSIELPLSCSHNVHTYVYLGIAVVVYARKGSKPVKPVRTAQFSAAQHVTPAYR